jgi:hypothetical protein
MPINSGSTFPGLCNAHGAMFSPAEEKIVLMDLNERLRTSSIVFRVNLHAKRTVPDSSAFWSMSRFGIGLRSDARSKPFVEFRGKQLVSIRVKRIPITVDW